MGMKDYFSKDENKRAHFVFDLIAPVYGIIDRGTHEDFKKMAVLLDRYIPLKGKSVLDVGCGTGAWLATLNAYDLQKAVGADFTEKMLTEARRNHPGLKCLAGDAENLSQFEDQSFDIVTATFVLHGMKAEKRSRVLNEMKRIARQHVVIHDFHGPSELIVRILETLERSDYKYFKKHFETEMQEHFGKSFLVNGVKGRALYIGIP